MHTLRAVALFVLVLLSLTTVAAHAVAQDKRECISSSTEGQVLRDEGKLREALEHFRTCSVDACPAVVRKSCVTWLGEVESLLPSIVLRVQNGDGEDLISSQVLVDGQAHSVDGKPLALNPGPHVVQVEIAGEVLEQEILLASGEKSRLVLLRPAAGSSEVSSSSDVDREDAAGLRVPAGAWALGGVALAGAASFTAFGLIAKNQFNNLERDCSPGCTDKQVNVPRTNALVADISLGVGLGALVAAVLVTAFSQKKGKRDERASDVRAVFNLAPRVGGALTTISVHH